MLSYVLRRGVQAPVVLLVISALTFFIMRLAPGDPFAGERAIDPAIQQARAERYGFDKPLIVQYGYWLANVASGDLDYSLVHKDKRVAEIINEHLPQSAYLGSLALLLALLMLPLWLRSCPRPRPRLLSLPRPATLPPPFAFRSCISCCRALVLATVSSSCSVAFVATLYPFLFIFFMLRYPSYSICRSSRASALLFMPPSTSNPAASTYAGVTLGLVVLALVLPPLLLPPLFALVFLRDGERMTERAKLCLICAPSSSALPSPSSSCCLETSAACTSYSQSLCLR